MTLQDLGYTETFEKLRIERNLEEFEIGRVTTEHRERYIVTTEKGEYQAEITGNLRFSARNREDFPAVGDWVALITVDPEHAIIHSILPRLSVLSRQAVGKFGEKQIIATNIDVAFLVQAVDRDFNINRLERYLTICHASKVSPVIVLTKTDLIDPGATGELIERIRQRIENIPVIAISNTTKEGYESLPEILGKGKTCCLLGSSGAGKSSLMNNLAGKDVMKTDKISASTSKGRHITSHRELTVLEGGGILIDNPGMREIGIVDPTDGVETAFDRIRGLSENCRFTDCTHTAEIGCAVLEALEQGELERKSYDNFLKIEREKAHFDLSVSGKRKKEKDFGKKIKNFKNDMEKLSSKHKDAFRK